MSKTITARPKSIILFILIFCFIISLGLIILLYTKNEIVVFLRLFIAFVVFSMFYTFKQLTYLSVHTNYIKTGFFTKYKYQDIASITLYDHTKYRFLFFPMVEACLTITLNNGKKIVVQDNYCANLWKLRWFLENRFIKNNTAFNFNFKPNFDCNTNLNTTSPITLVTKALPFILVLALVTLISSSLAAYCNIDHAEWFIITSALCVFILLIIAARSNYIESCDKALYIKNLVFKKQKTPLALDQINHIELKLISHGKGSTTQLIIHMVYHKVYRFSVDDLKQERLQNMISQLNKLNIRFQDLRG
ncbi:hypothetical protein [Psychroserpens sp. NJDZ02]|uniref:hypothetical protein n=1 Tax=Psychroserpens sp. NJDZ02 TaxID=2570561 RepID=UPI0010A8F4A7|nr:hypothetical protein [Psychroserpens sp. NJDZ02]QCE43032.1 hypothetical protein E9099_16945 [Psychroserpens sp. NJDZ02]